MTARSLKDMGVAQWSAAEAPDGLEVEEVGVISHDDGPRTIRTRLIHSPTLAGGEALASKGALHFASYGQAQVVDAIKRPSDEDTKSSRAAQSLLER